MKKENNLILTIIRFGLLLFFFNGFSQHQHPLIKYYNGDLRLTERQVDSLIVQTLEQNASDYLISLALYQKGVFQRRKGDDVGAFEKYITALGYLQNADTTDSYLLSAILRNQGAILHNYRLYEGAVELYERALNPSYEYSANRGVSTEYNIGLSMIQYEPEKALSLFLNLNNKLKDDYQRKARIYNQLGLFQKRVGQYKEAIDYYEGGLGFGITGRIKADLLQNISDVHYCLKDYPSQEHYLLLTLGIPKANRFIVLMDLGECYLLQGREEEAKAVLMEAELLYDEQPLRREHFKLFKSLKEVSEDPLIYADKLIEEQNKYIDRMDELKQKMETLAMKNLLVAVEADERRIEETGFYRLLAVFGGFVALVIFLTWRIWWYRLRNSLGNKINNITESKG